MTERLSFQAFALRCGVSYDAVRVSAERSLFTVVKVGNNTYPLVEDGQHGNGKPKYVVIITEQQPAKRTHKHLSESERIAAAGELNAGANVDDLARKYGVSPGTIYRLKNERRVSRKVRFDAGVQRIGIPPGAKEIFESIFIANAQCNARIAWERTSARFPGIHIPYRYALEWAKELAPVHMRANYAKKFEATYTPKIRRDLWTEFEFMECVSQDGWHVPNWVIGSKGVDVQPRALMAVDTKTGYPLAVKFMLRNENHEDVMSLNLELVHRWGRPSWVLMDNGAPFIDENTQRFVRGWWQTDEHESRVRVVHSEPYRPEGKGRHERLHRIFQDEFCAFLPDYSPNPRDSRKPEKQLSHVRATITLDEFTEKFLAYLNGPFMDRQRVMWMNPNLSRSHVDNVSRPRTMREALDRAYQTYQPVKVDPKRLAFLYAQKQCKEYRKGMFTLTINKEVFRYIPEEFDLSRTHESFWVVVNPCNMGQCWIVDMRENFICEAWDLRYKGGELALTRERASEARKIANKLEKQARDRGRMIQQIAEVDPVRAEKIIRRDGPPEIAVNRIEEALYKSDPLPRRVEMEEAVAEEEIDPELLAAIEQQQEEDNA